MMRLCFTILIAALLTACVQKEAPPSVVVRPVLIEPPTVTAPVLTQSQRRKIKAMQRQLKALEESLNEPAKPDISTPPAAKDTTPSAGYP